MRGAPAPLLTAVLAAGVLAACGGTSDAAVPALVAAMCDARDAPDGPTAAEHFEVHAHAPLHELADEVGRVDRTLTSRLLEAKFAVETVVRGDTEAPDALVHQRLVDLDREVRAALAALDRPAPDC